MSNVSFLRGLHASLPANGSAVNGAFYLTTDSHRLYVGDENKNLIDLNKYIITVAKLADLNDAEGQIGDFYYAEAENALVLRKADGWHLINKDTNNIIKSATDTFTVTAANDVATVKHAFQVKDDKDITVNANDSFTITGGKNIAVTSNGKNINIDGSDYTLELESNPTAAGEVDTFTLKLVNSLDKTNFTSCTIAAGDNVTLSKDANGVITISSSYVDTYANSSTTKLNADGSVSVDIELNNGNTITGTASAPITFKVGADGDTVKLPGESLNVYTINEIDSMMRGLNGMTYKGTVGTGGTVTSLPTSKVSSGDTYLVTGDDEVTYASGLTAKKGDLLIATGTEGTDGFLTSITWTYVPSGDDVEHDTTYKFKPTAASNKVELVVSTDETIKSGSISFATENNSALSITSTASGNNLVTTVNHNKIAAITPSTATASNATSVAAVSGVTVDAYGHITGYEVTTTNLMSYTIEGSSSVANDKATFNTILKNSAGDTIATASHALSSTSLEIESTTDGASIDLKWGSF